MNQNMLKLNDDKTELIVFASKYKQDLYNDLSITLCVCARRARLCVWNGLTNILFIDESMAV